VELARYVFNDVHTEQIAQLLHCFPKDHKTEQGQLFWSGPKRCPLVINYSSADPKHLEYVQGAANVFAFIFGLPQEKDAKKVAALAD
jgi:ubiquitin-activating enzyme E1